MLGAMEIAVGVLLGVAGLLFVGLVAAYVAGCRTETRPGLPPADAIDDLPDFLEFPPGSAGPARPATDSVVALAVPSRPAPPPSTPRRPPVPTAALAAALAGLVVLLLIAAVVAALPGRHGDGDRSGSGAERDHSADRGRPANGPAAGDEARLRFGGIVLEERAVGITVSYPALVLAADADGPVASLELPTWNCLAAEAPDDPADAGCVPGRTEHAELRSPDLEVTRDGDDLRITGDFATTTRPGGSDPELTGRSYELVITVSPDDSAAPDRWVPASGDLELGDHHASIIEGEMRIHA